MEKELKGPTGLSHRSVGRVGDPNLTGLPFPCAVASDQGRQGSFGSRGLKDPESGNFGCCRNSYAWASLESLVKQAALALEVERLEKTVLELRI